MFREVNDSKFVLINAGRYARTISRSYCMESSETKVFLLKGSLSIKRSSSISKNKSILGTEIHGPGKFGGSVSSVNESLLLARLEPLQ